MEAHDTMEHCGEALDVLALGSVMVEITPTEAGVPLAQVRELAALPGGAACNFSAALARLGVRVALATGVGEDEWGEWLRRRLAELGIDASRVKTVAGQLTTSGGQGSSTSARPPSAGSRSAASR